MRRFFLLALVLPHSILRADVDVPGLPGFALFGHLRLRYERDSDRNTGQPARAKLLAGNYLGVKYNPNAAWTFCTRLRAGAIDNPRARMVTVYRFDDSPYGDRGVFQDIYYVAWKAGSATPDRGAGAARLYDRRPIGLCGRDIQQTAGIPGV